MEKLVVDRELKLDIAEIPTLSSIAEYRGWRRQVVIELNCSPIDDDMTEQFVYGLNHMEIDELRPENASLPKELRRLDTALYRALNKQTRGKDHLVAATELDNKVPDLAGRVALRTLDKLYQFEAEKNGEAAAEPIIGSI